MDYELETSNRQEISWTARNLELALAVKKSVDALGDFLPLTLRQIYYQLVAGEHIPNDRYNYNRLSKIIKQMRLDEMLSWDAVEDRSRFISDKRGFTDKEDYLKEELDIFLSQYARCYVQGQEKHVELWIEKDGLRRIFENIAWPYCIRAVTCKGYQSVSFLREFAERASRAKKQGQTPVILYFGDLDPSGWQMLEATAQSLEDEHHIFGVEYKRIALNPEQVYQYNLPHSIDAIKEKDPRTKRYRQRFGNLAVELDALHPQIMQQMAIQAIRQEFDMELFEIQRDIENKERAELAKVKGLVMDVLKREGLVNQ